MDHADPVVVQIGPEKATSVEVLPIFFSKVLDCKMLTLILILIKSSNIFHWKSTTATITKKVGVVIGAKFGLN